MNAVRTALLLASFLALGACSEGGAKKRPETPPVPVAVAQAVARDMPIRLQVVGRAEAFESVALKARVDGQVAALLFSEGQHVRQGDLLIRLDPADFAARLAQAEAGVARDEALLAKTRADTTRYMALKDRNFVSEEKVNDTRTNEAAALANLRASKAAVEVARLQRSYTEIRAPISGVIGARLVFPGSTVKTNDTTLAVINRVQPLHVSFPIPEKHLPRLRAAMQAGALKIEAQAPNDATGRFSGVVRFIDNAVDAATGTILVKAELDNADELLTPGQFLNVSLILDTLANAVTVPDEAVQQGAEGNFVYVVVSDGTVEMRRIETAASDAQTTAVAKGLATGETVVTDGHLRLTPGAKVKIKEGDKAPAGKTDGPKANAPQGA
ncbi:efflux RND transporter periplasmic adaptor subunit [Propionivibrio sp.]|uniref:efflux RND transporter periplasmic adaptor subunit n=1 Tax=Propionivibrio sp. TaxID=2212460 RepID=UPI0025ECA777|nr:efflux RND transporter periplasmic adaptor subunit [Propionivibrio sp.]